MDDFGEYLMLERRIRLPQVFQQTLINLDNACQYLSSEPIFPCINEINNT